MDALDGTGKHQLINRKKMREIGGGGELWNLCGPWTAEKSEIVLKHRQLHFFNFW